jgi:hypothetical protein
MTEQQKDDDHYPLLFLPLPFPFEMPTVLLVDVSISLARPVVGAERTRKELVQRGLLHFLQHLEEHHPLELTSLITFSSEAKVIVPFTKDYTKLRTSLTEHLKLRDKTSLDSGLETVVRHVQESFFHPSSSLNSPIGLTSQVQIIVVTDGRSNGRLSPLSIEIPFPVKMQIVALGQRSELNLDELRQLTKIHNGILRFIELPQGARLFKKTFEEIAHENYASYSGSIGCGHLLSRVQLHPDPNLTLSHYLSCNSDLPPRIPEVLTILGFVHSKNISSPPTLSRHAVLPASLPLHDNAMDTSSTTNSENILCILLHQCLKAEKAFAVVQLDSSGKWYGLLSSLTEQERTGLVFSFLPPRLSLPWMGDFSAVFYPPLFEPTRMGAYRSYSAPPKGLTALPSLRPEVLSVRSNLLFVFFFLYLLKRLCLLLDGLSKDSKVR